MDPLLRGHCEQHIDEKLLEIDIQQILDIVKVLDLPISSEEDASIGIFLGIIYDVLATQCTKVCNRHPNSEEISDFYNILSRRANEFKTIFEKHHLLNEQEKEQHEIENTIEAVKLQIPDIEIDWGVRTRKKSKHKLFGIPLPIICT